MSDLDILSQNAELGKWLDTLTICGVGFKDPAETDLDSDGPRLLEHNTCQKDQNRYIDGCCLGPAPNSISEFEKDLTRILTRFPKVKHVRYVLTADGHLKGWSGAKSLSAEGFYTYEGATNTYGEKYHPGILGRFAKALVINNIHLERFSTPFKGNMSPTKNALTEDVFYFTGSPDQPLALMFDHVQTVAINFRFTDPIVSFDLRHLLRSLKHVRTLEIAISNTGGSGQLWRSFHGLRTGNALKALTNLEELRLSFTASDSMRDTILMIDVVGMLPKLRRLAIAYGSLASHFTWNWVLQWFSEKLRLDKLLLIEPLENHWPRMVDWHSDEGAMKYPVLKTAAKEIKVLQNRDLTAPWPLPEYLCFHGCE